MKLARDFRETARNSLRGRWGLAVLASFIASLLGGGISGSGFTANLNLGSLSDSSGTEAAEDIYAELITLLFLSLPYIIVSAVLAFVLGSIVKVGHAKFYLNITDMENASIGDLFSMFNRWKTLIVAELLRSIYVFLWTLLLVIPGIIASYSYAMVPFILSEDESITPSEALKKSKEMMYGNRMRLFCLHISFLGWAILCIFTLGIGFLWLTPYLNSATADFYRDVSGTYKIPDLIVDEPSDDDSFGWYNN